MTLSIPLRPPIRSRGQVVAAIALLALIAGPLRAATPFLPSSDGEVLERLSTASAGRGEELTRLRKALREDPADLAIALRVADRLIEVAQATGDTRYDAYAQAALAPWWRQAEPPVSVRLVRATLYQRQHDFDRALAEIDQVVRRAPREPRAWLLRSVVLRVTGDLRGALASCAPLRRLAPPLVRATCEAEIASLAGRARESHARLTGELQRAPNVDPRIRRWTTLTLADMAIRLGDFAAAEAHLLAAWEEEPDLAVVSTLADLWLEQGRAKEVLDLLSDQGRGTDLLLRAAIAARQAGAPQWLDDRDTLAARFLVASQRGVNPHLATEARFFLDLADRPQRALTLAARAWAVQKEPADALLLVRAALAAGRPAAAEPVLDWLHATGLEDRRIEALIRRIEEERS